MVAWVLLFNVLLMTVIASLQSLINQLINYKHNRVTMEMIIRVLDEARRIMARAGVFYLPLIIMLPV
jgi:hypothetical protein